MIAAEWVCDKWTGDRSIPLPNEIAEKIILYAGLVVRPDGYEYRRGGKLHGWCVTHRDGGTYRQHYVDGELHGESLVYHKEGWYDILSYSNGKLHGVCRGFYKDGRIRDICRYINNVIHGEMTIWSENGQRILVRHYTHGLIDNESMWFNTGVPMATSTYLNGVLQYAEWYNSDGKLTDATHFVDGTSRFTRYMPNGDVWFQLLHDPQP